MQRGLKGSFIWAVVFIIAGLLATLFIFSYRNSRFIDENLKARHQAQVVKLNTLDIIRSLHLMDLGLRGYALVSSDQIGSAYDSGRYRLGVILPALEKSLIAQNFNMPEFYQMKDSVDSYLNVAQTMFADLKQGKREEFLNLLKADYGYNTWSQYLRFSARITEFENAAIAQANQNYQAALRRNSFALIFLIILVVPTLLYTAYSTVKAYGTSEQLRQASEEKNKILANQNETLERLVKERTDEIAAQNEEIQSNLEAISRRNQQLEDAKKIIEQKNQIIEVRNKGLGLEVEKQTKYLRESNMELIRNINQLEQFSYTVSHNLRAPVARIIGLTEILKHADGKVEEENILNKIADASRELDQVMKDLMVTIEMKKEINNALVDIDVNDHIEKTLGLFNEDIVANNINIAVTLHAPNLKSVPAYVDSIFYNLMSNAVKYRNPGRPLKLEIATAYQKEWFVLTVKDNGIGLDVDRNKRDLFSFYKRFHFHVEGRGLGLFLVKSQTELLGGTIDVQSTVDVGTTFTVKLKHNLNSAT
jgi:signal transduction histidine kinase